MALHIVCGPPAAGKTTYVNENRQSGDVVIDHDALAVALGSSDSHDHPAAIARAAHVARGATMKAARDIDADVWVIHTDPDESSLANYREQGAEIVVVDPGESVVRERLKHRPESSQAAVDAWYSRLPAIKREIPDRGANPDKEKTMTDPSAAAPQDASPPPQTVPAGPSDGDKGFPDGTPLAEMNDAQKAAYWQHYARKHEDTVKAFNGLTPQQVKDLQAQNEAFAAEKMTADEKAVATARKEAADAAAAAAKAEYLPQIQKLQVQGIAASVIQGDKLNAFMSVVNPAALVDDKGAVDETKVMGYLTAMYGDATPPSNPGPRWQNFGQFAAPPPPAKAGSGGAAEAQKRFGTKTT
jgi:hypothetical protein